MYWDYADALLHTEKNKRETHKRTWFEAKDKSGRHRRERHERKSQSQKNLIIGIFYKITLTAFHT